MQQPRQIVVRRVITRVVIHHPAAAHRARQPPHRAAVQTGTGARGARPRTRTRTPDHPVLVITLTELTLPRDGHRPSACSPPRARRSHAARTLIEDLEARLTRFDPDSELSRLNADPRETVPASRAAARRRPRRAGGRRGHRRARRPDAARRGRARPATPARSSATRAPTCTRRCAPRPRRARRHPTPAALWRRVHVDDARRHDHAPARHPARPRRQRQGPRGRPRRRAARPARPVRGRPRRRPARPRHARGARPEPAHRPDRGRDRAAATTPSPPPGIDRRLWWDRRAPGASPASTRRPAGPRGPACSRATAKAPSAALAEALAKAAILDRPGARPRDPEPPRRRADRDRHDATRSAWSCLVAGQPRVRRRRARADRRLGRARLRDGGEGVPRARPPAHPDRGPRARGAWPRSSRSPSTASRCSATAG